MAAPLNIDKSVSLGYSYSGSPSGGAASQSATLFTVPQGEVYILRQIRFEAFGESNNSDDVYARVVLTIGEGTYKAKYAKTLQINLGTYTDYRFSDLYVDTFSEFPINEGAIISATISVEKANAGFGSTTTSFNASVSMKLDAYF